MNKNLNLYKIFYEVAKYKSISAAAKSMYLSQPAVSKSIKTLESDLNVTLFYRSLNGIILTEEGKELFKYVEIAFDNLRLAEKKISETENLERGSLTIGIRSHIASFYIVDKIIDYHKKYPKININIINRPSAELIELLDENKLDFIIDVSSYKDNLENYDVKNLGDLEHCFAVKRNSNILKEDREYSLKDLENLPLILPVSHSTHRKALDQIALEKGIKFTNVLSVETSELIYDFINKGVGIGYILKNIIQKDVDNGSFKIIKLKERLPAVCLKLIYSKKKLTNASAKFIDDYLNEI